MRVRAATLTCHDEVVGLPRQRRKTHFRASRQTQARYFTMTDTAQGITGAKGADAPDPIFDAGLAQQPSVVLPAMNDRQLLRDLEPYLLEPHPLRPTATGVAVGLLLWLLGCLPLSAAGPDTEPPLSARAPLIDAAARAEVDGYARLDQVMTRAAEIPDVFDPSVYAAGTTPEDLRSQLLRHILWLQGHATAHLAMIESLPFRFAEVTTREPYRQAFIEHYRVSGPERYRMIQSIYQEEISAAEHRVAFVDWVAAGDIRPAEAGFTFSSEADAQHYRDMIAEINRSSGEQDRRIATYYAWEIEQKKALRRFRDQL